MTHVYNCWHLPITFWGINYSWLYHIIWNLYNAISLWCSFFCSRKSRIVDLEMFRSNFATILICKILSIIFNLYHIYHILSIIFNLYHIWWLRFYTSWRFLIEFAKQIICHNKILVKQFDQKMIFWEIFGWNILTKNVGPNIFWTEIFMVETKFGPTTLFCQKKTSWG